jgi:hypothetical protein
MQLSNTASRMILVQLNSKYPFVVLWQVIPVPRHDLAPWRGLGDLVVKIYSFYISAPEESWWFCSFWPGPLNIPWRSQIWGSYVDGVDGECCLQGRDPEDGDDSASETLIKPTWLSGVSSQNTTVDIFHDPLLSNPCHTLLSQTSQPIVVEPLLCNQDLPGSNLGPDTGYSDTFRDFPLSLVANTGILP